MRISITLACLLCALVADLARGADANFLWADQVQPLLDRHCVKCHGPIEQKSDLVLDTPEGVMKGGYEGLVVTPGIPEESRLYRYLAEDSDPHMPPKKQLTKMERDTIRAWILAMGTKLSPSNSSSDQIQHFESVSSAVDHWISIGWKQRGLAPAPPADERTWCRRVYLDLIGRIPSRDELDSFLYAPDDSKRSALVDQLLASDAYAVHMRELWDTFLMGRGKRASHEDRRRKNGWWTFLENAFREDKPWSETVREFLVARPDSNENKGATWFLYERRNQHQAIAEAVAPVVYGTKMDCAQCHDHPLAREIKQGHYWGLVAAFNRSKNVKDSTGVSESAVGGFVNFTNLEKESQPAVVMLMTGHVVEEDRPADGEKEEDSDDKYVDSSAKVRVPKFSRRQAFADAATHDNPLLARAFVNRMWGTLLGRGLVHPVDQMNARNRPSHPELLDWLAEDFATHDYDIRRLIRGLVLSHVYGLKRTTALQPTSFAGATERPLAGEQIARSWRVAAGLAPEDDSLRRAVIAAMPDVLPEQYNATFQQAQFLTSSAELDTLLEPTQDSTLFDLSNMPNHTLRVRELFLRVYGRLPDSEETEQAVNFLNEHSAEPIAATRDLMWALMTSAEFLTMP